LQILLLLLLFFLVFVIFAWKDASICDFHVRVLYVKLHPSGH